MSVGKTATTCQIRPGVFNLGKDLRRFVRITRVAGGRRAIFYMICWPSGDCPNQTLV